MAISASQSMLTNLTVLPFPVAALRCNLPSADWWIWRVSSLCAGTLDINYAEILESLAFQYSAVTAELNDVPLEFAAFVSVVTTQLSADLKEQLICVVEPAARPVIEEQIAEAETFAPAKLIPSQAKMMRNNAPEAVQGFVNAGAQFFGFGGEN